MTIAPTMLPTPELGLEKAQDADDTADYLVTGLANSLTTLDSLFNNVTGHTHAGVHQGGPISSIPASAIPDGSITSAKIQDGGIQSLDLADGSVTTPKLADAAVVTAKIATGVTLTSPIINNATENSPNISGTVTGGPTFSSGPSTTDWFRVATAGQGLYNVATSTGVALDTVGALPYGGNYANTGHYVTESGTQTLTNKTLAGSTTLTNPTLSGTISGSPTWSSGQTFPQVASTSGFYLPNAQNAVLTASTRSGANSGEAQINSYLNVPGDIYSGTYMHAISFISTSDPELKQNLVPMTDTACMGRVRDPSVQVQTYTWPAANPPAGYPEPTAQDIGFSAPQVYANSPEFCALDATSQPVGVDYAHMAALLWGALRDLDARCRAYGVPA